MFFFRFAGFCWIELNFNGHNWVFTGFLTSSTIVVHFLRDINGFYLVFFTFLKVYSASMGFAVFFFLLDFILVTFFPSITAPALMTYCFISYKRFLEDDFVLTEFHWITLDSH